MKYSTHFFSIKQLKSCDLRAKEVWPTEKNARGRGERNRKFSYCVVIMCNSNNGLYVLHSTYLNDIGSSLDR